MRRGAAAAAIGIWCATALALASAAPAATVTAVDDARGLEFRLDGPQLTVVALTPEAAERGVPLRAACGTSFGFFVAPVTVRPLVAPTSWPEGADRVEVTFARDVSAQAAWCVLELEDGGDVGSVSFVAPEPVRAVASGRLADGRRWRLAASRDERQIPHGALEVGDGDDADRDEHGFLGAAGRPALLETLLLQSERARLVWGVAPPRARRVEIALRGGARVTARTFATPPGSATRARWFAVELPARATARTVTVRDAAGRTLRRAPVPATVPNPFD